jgi:hypothetical protein
VDLLGEELAAAVFDAPSVDVSLTAGLARVEMWVVDLALALQEDVVALRDPDLLGCFERLPFVHGNAGARR